jgi:RING finger protein 113A
MFRKPKRKLKDSLRRNEDTTDTAATSNGARDSDRDEDDGKPLDVLSAKRQQLKKSTAPSTSNNTAGTTSLKPHAFDTVVAGAQAPSAAELAVSTAQQHQEARAAAATTTDGIFRDTTRNKFHAGPIRAAQHVRVTARFDYQPDVCKDYKQTGYCGFGDSCIYLHSREDTLSGWQLEEKWEMEQRAKKEQAQEDISNFVDQFQKGRATTAAAALSTDDGLPFCCHLCRGPFREPVVTRCGHYFCQACILQFLRNDADRNCPVCHKETHGVLNQPTKLLAKRRKLLSSSDQDESDDAKWSRYADLFRESSAS